MFIFCYLLIILFHCFAFILFIVASCSLIFSPCSLFFFFFHSGLAYVLLCCLLLMVSPLCLGAILCTWSHHLCLGICFTFYSLQIFISVHWFLGFYACMLLLPFITIYPVSTLSNIPSYLVTLMNITHNAMLLWSFVWCACTVWWMGPTLW